VTAVSEREERAFLEEAELPYSPSPLSLINSQIE